MRTNTPSGERRRNDKGWAAHFCLLGALGLLACSSDAPVDNAPAMSGGSAGQAPNAGGHKATAGAASAGTPGNGGQGANGGAPSAGAQNGGAPGAGLSGTGAVSGGTPSSGAAGAPVAGAPVAGAPVAGTAGSPGSAGTGGSTAGACTTEEEMKFSFFMTSHAGLVRLSGNPDGFGGDLGGITGADSICQRLAESSSPCQASKVWRAFLSTTTEDAIDRIGAGPWYDRRGRLLANNKEDLLPTGNDEVGGRPRNAAPEIRNDFPNEDGFPNQYPDGGTMEVDNHQTITGSGSDGRLYRQTGMSGGATSATGCQDPEGWTPEAATCWNWTSKEPKGCPRVGHSWGGLSGYNWISVWNESGCAPGGTLLQIGGTDRSRKIGSGGGYGGFYCFAVTP